jgi:hypothetical protein
MFTRSTLPTLTTIVMLAFGSHAGAETLDPNVAPPGTMVRQTKSLSSSYALRSDFTSLRSVARDSIEPCQPTLAALRAEPAWPDSSASSAARAGGRLTFHRAPDDVRAGTSSASITLGRLNLNEPRSNAALGGTTLADLDRELAQLRDSVNRVRLVPQVSLGMRVKF